MRIALATAQVPFVRGGAELLAESLHRELVSRGHEVETLKIPFNWYPTDKLQDSMLAGSLLNLDKIGGHPIDLVIGLKFPAYLAQHPNKVFWLIHQHRQAYDHWDQGISDLLHQPKGRQLRSAIQNADREAFANRRMFTISQTVSDRLQSYLSIASKPLYHPPPIAHLLTPGTTEDYVLVPSRLNSEKRQDLVLRALAECNEPVRAIFVGAPDDDSIAAQLRSLAAKLKLESRVEWRSAVSAEDLAELYRHALAIVFVPHNEDYGYVTLEAMLAGKPVITVSDAGGPLEFIQDGLQGLVSEPSPAALARSLSAVWSDRALAQELGKAGLKRYQDLEIGWDSVINQLLGNAAKTAGVSLAQIQSLAARASAGDASNDRKESIEVALPLALADDNKSGNRTSEIDPSALPDAPYEFIPKTGSTVARAGVNSIAELFRAFDFGPSVNEEIAAYLDSHWLRYLQTAAMLPNQASLRILDLGAVRPHVFLGLLKLLHPHATFEAAVEKDYEAIGFEQFASRRDGPPLQVKTASFNVETDVFPYAENIFDVVLAMEVVEHLALNPAHMFSEVERVLRPNGKFIVTTPNITSDMALKKIFFGHAPYSFGVFVPYHGIYGRHNREYTPHEIELLGLSAGLSTASLFTKDVYLKEIDNAHAFAARFPDVQNPASLRGQNIFYIGSKSGAARDARPSPLYLEDPFAFLGSVVAQPPTPGSSEIILTLLNNGRKDWGDRTLNLVFTIIGGEAEHGAFIRMPLPIFVPAGEQRNLSIAAAPLSKQASCVLMARLERQGRGWLNSIGVKDIRFVAHAGALDAIARQFSTAK
jgi:glycosyltransferase involved in cell wall biosynthesis/SAM-dependent methyltransferase